MNKYKAVIFDMDGVLVDTEQFYYDRRETFMNSQGISISHLAPSFFIGGNMKNVWSKILLDDYDKWDLVKLQADYVAYKNSHPLPYKELLFPQTREVLEALKQAGYRLALASSSTNHDIKKMLADNKLADYFEFTSSGEDFKETKPNPEIYQVTMDKLGLKPDEVLIVEDSEKGIQAGVAAGATVWAIEDKRFGMNQENASRLIASLDELRDELV
ncbi:HAD family phosphatase [Streptococcaceae bacterium ESL0687]|nr:HAD family phosphatase [Streptococcaceae bacterium ESL0687]